MHPFGKFRIRNGSTASRAAAPSVILTLGSLFVISANASAQNAPLFNYELWPGADGSSIVRSGDFNNDGIADFVTNGYATASIGISLGLGNGKFLAPVNYPTAALPSRVEVADMNNDGIADCVTANLNANGLNTLPGNGTGGFGAPVGTVVSINSNSFAIADMNLDGINDVIETHVNANINIALGTGTGAFLNNTIPVATAKFSVHPGDFNHDGKPDAAFGDIAKNNITIYRGTGTATPILEQTFTNISSPYGMASADLDHDGNTDLVAAATTFGQITVLQGVPSGFFTLGGTFAAGADTRGIAIADLNHDTHPDVVVTNYSSGRFTYLQGNGNGTFATPVFHSAAGNPVSIVLADLNGDTHPDVLVNGAASNAVLAALGDGSGGFSSEENHTVGTSPQEVFLADLNHDGWPDLFTTNLSTTGTTTAILANGAGGFGAPVTSLRTGVSVAGDFTGDGVTDVFLLSNANGTLQLRSGDGAGSFNAVTTLAAASCVSIDAGDLDLDGKLDIAATRNIFILYDLMAFLNIGGGSFAAPVISANNPNNNILISDATNDGLPDAVTSTFGRISICGGAGNGSFVLGTQLVFPQAQICSRAAGGDLDLDGWIDYAIAESQFTNPAGIYLFKNTTGALSLATFTPTTVILDRLAIQDFNNDGIADVLGVSGTSDLLESWVGTGGFVLSDRRLFVAGDGPVSLATGDLDLNGRIDGVSPNAAASTVTILRNIFPGYPATATYGAGTFGCNGRASIEVNSMPHVNNPQFVVTTTNVPANSLGILLITDSQDAAGTDLFGLGILIHVDFLLANDALFYDMVSDAKHYSAAPAPTPNDPALAGRSFYLQSLWYEANCATTFSHFNSSNGIALTIQP